MSYKFDSLIIILNKLDGRARVTAESLREDLEVSKRTVHRYISTLQTAGFPIDYDRNQKTYAFTNGYALKKPNLSLEETLAFHLARKLLGSFGPGMEKGLGSIEEKLTVVRSPQLKHIVLSPETVSSNIEQYLLPIHQAAMNYQKIKVTYKAYDAKNPVVGTIDPYYLFYRDGIWYFRGFYHTDKAPRTFAFDRIMSLTLLNEHFIPARVSPQEELSGAFGAFIDGESVDVVLKFDEEYKPLILRKKWHPSQQVKELNDGFEVTFTVNGIWGIRQWIYQWMPHVEIVAPDELRNIFCDDMVSTLKKHGKMAKETDNA